MIVANLLKCPISFNNHRLMRFLSLLFIAMQRCSIGGIVVGFSLATAAHAAAPSDKDDTYFDSFFECQSPLVVDQQAKMVAKVQQRYSELKNLQGHFRQESVLAALDQSEQSAGTMTYEHPARMRWDYVEPDKQRFLIDGRTVWLYQESQKQVMIDEVSKLLISDLPVAFLLGVGNLEKDFNLMTACQTKQGAMLEFAPKGAAADGELKSFTLAVSTKTSLPIGARVFDVGGNRTTITLENLQADQQALSKDFFAPKFPEGIDVTDRRQSENKATAAVDSNDRKTL